MINNEDCTERKLKKISTSRPWDSNLSEEAERIIETNKEYLFKKISKVYEIVKEESHLVLGFFGNKKIKTTIEYNVFS